MGISKFTGESKPEIWLEDYRVAVQIGGGDDNVAMKHLPLMLEGSARAWLNQLPPSSIYCWDDQARVPIKTFEGMYKQAGALSELLHCVQRHNETLWEYIQGWTTLHNMVKNITEHQAICAFKAGIKYRELALKFGRTEIPTLSRAMEIANRYANGEEDDRLRSGKGRANDARQSDNKNKKQKRKADAVGNAEAAALAGQIKGKGQPKQKKEWVIKKKAPPKSEILNQPCQIHTKRDEDGNLILPKHTTRECRLLKYEMRQDHSEGKDEEEYDDGDKYASGYPQRRESLDDLRLCGEQEPTQGH